MGEEEPEDIIKGLECGADNFITKPYDKELLMSRIQYILVNQEIRKGSISQIGIEFFFAGKKHFINSDRLQILDLFFASYENALQQKRELELSMAELETFTLRIDPSSVYFFRFILEGYDNMFVLSTVDQRAGLVEVRAVKGSLKDLLLILRSLKSIIGLDRMDSRCNAWIMEQLMI